MEFIVVFPVLILLVSAILQFAHIWIAREVTAYAAYCATRAVLSTCEEEEKDEDGDGQGDDERLAATRAAQRVCAWLCFAGLSTTVTTEGTSQSVKAANLTGKMSEGSPFEDNPTDTVYLDNGAPVLGDDGEVEIPGWGTIPGSDSITNRVEATVVHLDNDGLVTVAVKFKFPLLFPLVGRMIAWTANEIDDMSRGGELDHYGTHDTTADGFVTGWRGETVVLNDRGETEELTDGSDWNDVASSGKYPFIPIVEACVLPMPYKAPKYSGTGSLLVSGGELR